MTHDEFIEEVERIPYRYRAPRILYGLIRWLEPDVIVEVGTHIGYAACWMGRALEENGHGRLYCIDNWCWTEHDQKAQWEVNLAACGVRDVVTLIEGRSQEVCWPESIDFAYVDGNHTYPTSTLDCIKAKRLGAAVIAIHDTVACEGTARMARTVRYLWHDWDVLEDNAEQGLLIAKRQEPKPEPTVMDCDEKWDVT